MDRFFSDEDWMLPAMPGMKMLPPAMDVYETEKEVIAEITAPGYDADKIDISVKNGILTVRGGMEAKKEEKDKNYWRKEIRKGSFERIVRLPAEVDESKVEATYDKGILKIAMPKTRKGKPENKIKVKTKIA